MVLNHNTIETKDDVPLLKNLAIPIETLPNLRRVDPAGKLFRSSRQDLVSQADTANLVNLGIRTVIDLRSKAEYNHAKGDKIFDNCSDIVEVAIPKKSQRQKSLENEVQVKPLFRNRDGKLKALNINTTNEYSEVLERRRYLVDFYTSEYVYTVFQRVPFYKQIFSLLFLIVDIVFRTHYRYFVSYFAKVVINPAGLLGSYIDMLEISSTQICLALKILSEPANLPALVSCAHGKDRTGIVVSLVLSILGKSDDYIAQEYALSEEGLEPIRNRVYKEIVEDRSIDESFTHAGKKTMKGMLDYLNINYGSVPNYLESIGFTREDQMRLVKAFEE